MTGGTPGVPMVNFGTGPVGGLAGAVPCGAPADAAEACPLEAAPLALPGAAVVAADCVPPAEGPVAEVLFELLLHAASVSATASTAPVTANFREMECCVM